MNSVSLSEMPMSLISLYGQPYIRALHQLSHPHSLLNARSDNIYLPQIFSPIPTLNQSHPDQEPEARVQARPQAALTLCPLNITRTTKPGAIPDTRSANHYLRKGNYYKAHFERPQVQLALLKSICRGYTVTILSSPQQALLFLSLPPCLVPKTSPARDGKKGNRKKTNKPVRTDGLPRHPALVLPDPMIPRSSAQTVLTKNSLQRRSPNPRLGDFVKQSRRPTIGKSKRLKAGARSMVGTAGKCRLRHPENRQIR